MKNKFVAVLLSILMSVTIVLPVNAEPIEIEFEDASMGLMLYPFMQNGVMMVPLREMAEKLNFLVTWDETENAANLLRVNMQAKIYAGSNLSIVDGNEFILPCNSVIIGGSLYCPLAFIKEITKLEFAWDYNTKTLTIFANSVAYNAFSFAKEKTKKRIIIKNPLDPSKFASVEAAYAYTCYPSSENVYVTEECLVQECKAAGTGEWAYAKYDTKELKSLLSQIKSECEIKFWAKTTSEEGNTLLLSVKSGAPNIARNFEIDTEWKEYSAVLTWNPQIDIPTAYVLIGMRRYSAGEKVYVDGLSINPVE